MTEYLTLFDIVFWSGVAWLIVSKIRPYKPKVESSRPEHIETLPPLQTPLNEPIRELLDADAVECMVTLGYSKKNAMQRVLSVFSSGMSTSDTIKKALQVKI